MYEVFWMEQKRKETTLLGFDMYYYRRQGYILFRYNLS